jgi:enamine deaminase RidA (YjgF/YER057c/UK114 family)
MRSLGGDMHVRIGIGLKAALIVGICALAPAAAFAQAGGGQGGETPEARLKALGLELPTPAKPIANYVPAVRVGNLVFLSGHGECSNALTGVVGRDVPIEKAYASARNVGLCLLASLKAEIGDLSKVRRVVKLLGMVNAAPDFPDQPKVINGCSDLLVQVFGDRGKHARSAVGMGSLPGRISVEIEMIVEVQP